jgi:hypothetical protein
MLNSLTEKIAWAILTIKDDQDLDKGITDVDLAKILGTNKNTLAGYRNGKGLLKGEVIDRLISRYHFNPMWLFKGEGEPFPGARAKYKDVCGPEIVEATPHNEKPIISDVIVNYTSRSESIDPSGTHGFSIADDLMLAAKVLESKTHYATSLHLNIRSFAGGINDINVLNQMKDVQARMIDLEGKMEGLKEENDRLREDIRKLKGSSGGCPPIALEMDHAAPTGTDDPAT